METRWISPKESMPPREALCLLKISTLWWLKDSEYCEKGSDDCHYSVSFLTLERIFYETENFPIFSKYLEKTIVDIEIKAEYPCCIKNELSFETEDDLLTYFDEEELKWTLCDIDQWFNISALDNK